MDYQKELEKATNIIKELRIKNVTLTSELETLKVISEQNDIKRNDFITKTQSQVSELATQFNSLIEITFSSNIQENES